MLRDYSKIICVFLNSDVYEAKFAVYNIKFMTVIFTVFYVIRLRFTELCSGCTDNRKGYIDTVNAKP